ncbi:RNA polymerase subunit sigma-70 [Georgenia sp. Z1344]|uniref:RNA polymerase subunit sigma-70 n=1 Tax=Georgenia sp. Z1344 TaxID=3416706 RepID=UPI003CF18D3D
MVTTDASPGPAAVSEEDLDGLRRGLTGFCYRMLGDAHEAEDAAQETLVRLWQAADRFDPARGSLRTWAYAAASRVCIDLHRRVQRRALPMDLTGPARPGTAIGEPEPERWVTPVADDRAVDPAETAVGRESLRIALVVALQRLSAQQRAVLLLRDVYGLSARQTAEALGLGESATHSTLQRARRALDPGDRGDALVDGAPVDTDLLERYRVAFEAHDVDLMRALLHEDVRNSMPPFSWWLDGREDVLEAFAQPGGCQGHRLVPFAASGTTMFGQYRPEGAVWVPFAVLGVEAEGGRVRRTITWLDAAGRFAELGLPERLGSTE